MGTYAVQERGVHGLGSANQGAWRNALWQNPVNPAWNTKKKQHKKLQWNSYRDPGNKNKKSCPVWETLSKEALPFQRDSSNSKGANVKCLKPLVRGYQNTEESYRSYAKGKTNHTLLLSGSYNLLETLLWSYKEYIHSVRERLTQPYVWKYTRI